MYEGPVYVAGHTGLLGGALLRRLAGRGGAGVLTRGRAELDLTCQAAVEEFFASERPGTVFLAAGLTGGIGDNIERPADFLHVNLAIQDNVFEAARRHKAAAVIFFGSSCVYPVADRPLKEEDLLSGPIEATSEAYAIAKIAGIKACAAYNRQQRSTRYMALVPNSIYGPGDSFDPDRSHVLAALVRRICDAKESGAPSVRLWGTGAPRRELIYSDDAAEAAIFALERAAELENAHYNAGSGQEISISALAEAVSKSLGWAGRIEWDPSRPDGAARKVLDSSKLASLGWSARVGLEEGIRRTCQWYVNERLKAGRLKERGLSACSRTRPVG